MQRSFFSVKKKKKINHEYLKKYQVYNIFILFKLLLYLVNKIKNKLNISILLIFWDTAHLSKEMNFASTVRLAIVFAAISAASTFIVSFSACGILSSKVIAYFFGALTIFLILFDFYYMYKSTNPSLGDAHISPILIVVIITLVLTGGITTFVRSTKLYTLNSTSARFAYTLMITTGLASSISFVTPNILIKIFQGSGIIPDVILSEPNFLLLSLTITNIACGVFTSLLFGLGDSGIYNENAALKTNCIYLIISVFIGAIVGAFIGVIVEFRAESFGYRPDEI